MVVNGPFSVPTGVFVVGIFLSGLGDAILAKAEEVTSQGLTDDITPIPEFKNEEIISQAAGAGIAIGTFSVGCLFMFLLVSSNKIAELCCRHRTIVRKEGRYDTWGDGFDNPAYPENQDFALMYSPQGGVHMVGPGEKESKKHTSSKGVDEVDGQSWIPGENFNITGIKDGNDIYVDMASIKKEPCGKVKKAEVRNPLYDVEHQSPALATQSSAELFIDYDTINDSAIDSGLPSMSILQVQHCSTPQETSKTYSKAIYNQRAAAATGFETQTLMVGSDNTQLTAPSIELEMNLQRVLKSEAEQNHLVVTPIGFKSTNDKERKKTNDHIEVDIDSDIPIMLAPSTPTELQNTLLSNEDDEEMYAILPMAENKMSDHEKMSLQDLDLDEFYEEIPPPVPPRMYTPEPWPENMIQPTDTDLNKEDGCDVSFQHHVDEGLYEIPIKSKAEQVSIIDPDVTYASIEYDPGGLHGTPCGPPPPFPLDTPTKNILPSYSNCQPEMTMPATPSLADATNCVLGSSGEIIPLPTRKVTKFKLFDKLFTNDDGDNVDDKDKTTKRVVMGLVNPLYEFEATDVNVSPTIDNASVIMPTSDASNAESDDERESEAYRDLVQTKP